MKNVFRHRTRDGRIYIVKKGVGLFGPRLVTIASFDANDGNKERVRQIVLQLNECERRTVRNEP